MSLLPLPNTGAIAVANDAQPARDLGLLGNAFRACLPELAALPKRQLQVVNFDIPTAYTKALGAEDWLSVYRERVAALPGFDIGQWDRLTLYAKAMLFAHIEYRTALKGQADVEAQLEVARRWFKILRADIETLLVRGALPSHVRRALKTRRGHVGVFSNLLTLVAVFRRHWSSIAAKTTLTEAELSEAECIGEQLMFALGSRNAPVRDLKQFGEARQRAFTLFSRAYSQVRRAMLFLCWETSEAERLPSLYPRRARGARSKAKVPAPAASAVATQPDENAPVKTKENENRRVLVADGEPFV